MGNGSDGGISHDSPARRCEPCDDGLTTTPWPSRLPSSSGDLRVVFRLTVRFATLTSGRRHLKRAHCADLQPNAAFHFLPVASPTSRYGHGGPEWTLGRRERETGHGNLSSRAVRMYTEMPGDTCSSHQCNGSSPSRATKRPHYMPHLPRDLSDGLRTAHCCVRGVG